MKKLLSKLRFGLVHAAKSGIPGGNLVTSVIEGFTGKDLATGETKTVGWDRVVYKAIGAAIILYLLAKGYIPVDVVLDFVKKFV